MPTAAKQRHPGARFTTENTKVRVISDKHSTHNVR